MRGGPHGTLLPSHTLTPPSVSLGRTALYPLLYYAYYHAYDTYIKSEEWTFVYSVGLGMCHALSFLLTKWSDGVNVKVTCTTVGPGGYYNAPKHV